MAYSNKDAKVSPGTPGIHLGGSLLACWCSDTKAVFFFYGRFQVLEILVLFISHNHSVYWVLETHLCLFASPWKFFLFAYVLKVFDNNRTSVSSESLSYLHNWLELRMLVLMLIIFAVAVPGGESTRTPTEHCITTFQGKLVAVEENEK